MSEMPKNEPTNTERAAPIRQARRRKHGYKPTDADGAMVNREVRRRYDRPVAPRRNEAGPGVADRARTEVPKSGPSCEATDAGRVALNAQAQQQKEQQPFAPRLNEAGPGDADHAMTEVPNSKPKYEPTDAERAVLERQAQRQQEPPVAPRLKVVADYRGVRVELDHPDQVVAHVLLKDALGTTNDDFCLGLLNQMYEFVGLEDSPRVEIELNHLLSMIITGKPKDEVHATLLFQIGINSMIQMRAGRNFWRIQADSLRIMRDLHEKDPFVIRELNSLTKNLSLLQDSSERSYNRFARTYCVQLETSDRHRWSGEPSTTVHVAPGGQAIVGNVTQATPQTPPTNAASAPRALTDQQHSAMPIIGEPDRVVVPIRRRKKHD